MRVILFRGKRIDNGEWVEGYFFKWPCVSWKELSCVIVPVIGLENGIAEQAIVDPATIGQYTGLTDKNGVKIFEGDIVEGLDFSVDDGYGVVSWDDGGFLVFNGSLCGSFVENYNGRDFEVIGNIHDHPELMEAQDD